MIGPNADRVEALFGCYSFVNHVIPQHPGTATGIVVADRARGARRGVARRRARRRAAAARSTTTTSPASRMPCAAAARSDVAVVVVGDHAGPLRPRHRRGGLRPRRPRAARGPAPARRGRARHGHAGGPRAAHRPALRRRLGAGALCRRGAGVLPRRGGRPARSPGVLSGRVNPSGRLPVSLPRSAGAQPYTYLHPAARRGRRRHQPADHAGPARSGTGCRTPRSGTTTSRCTRRYRPASRWWPGCGSPTPATGAGPTSCSSTAATSSARSPARWPSCSASTGSTSRPGESAEVDLHGADRPAGLHRPDLAPRGRARRVEVWVGPSCAERETEGAH